MTRTRPAAELVELAPQVYGYVQPDGGWCVSNAGVLTGAGAVTVIDTLATEARATALRERVAALAAGPVRTVVNTHFHGDHTFGNQFFPGAALIGHRRLREELLAAGLSLTNLWPDVEWGALEVTPPTILLDDQLTIYTGDLELQLLHLGPAHTTNDVVGWVPEHRVLFAGDILMSGCTPFVLMGSLSGSLLAIDRLRALAPRTVLCGHGAVAGPEVIEANARYLRWLTVLAAQGKSSGVAPLELARDADLGEFADWLDATRLVANLHRAYAELDGLAAGAPIDVLGAFDDIIALSGGRPPDCWA